MPTTDRITIEHDNIHTDHVNIIKRPPIGFTRDARGVTGVLRLTPAEAEQARRELNRLLCRQCGQSGEVQDGDGRTYACRCVEL